MNGDEGLKKSSGIISILLGKRKSCSSFYER